MTVISVLLRDSTLNIYKEIKHKSGINFDIAYCNKVVSMHRDAVLYFDKAYIELSNADVVQWITAIFPYLQTDLDKALACQRKLKSTYKKQLAI